MIIMNSYNINYKMNDGAIGPKDEPTTTAKVIMTTTSGELQIEIWAKEAPLAARNFIQLAMQGYYDNTIFHRMIPGFMIQGGDPTGTGTGGESIYGGAFKDEFHQRLKFGRRGMVAMANSGKDTNGSQFFITFAECPHLNKKHTIFGKVVGDSVYNLLTFQSLDTNQEDRPTYPPSIRKIRVVLNPFDDIIPRNLKPKAEPKQNIEQSKTEEKKQKKIEIKKLKNKNKLTFEQEDAGNDDENYKIKSSHDALNDEKLSKKVAVTQQELEKKRKEKQEEQERKKQIVRNVNEVQEKNMEKAEISEIIKADLLKKKRNAEENADPEIEDEVLNYRKRVNPQTGKIEIVWNDEQQQEEEGDGDGEEDEKMRNLRELQERQYEALRADELNFKKMKEGSAKERRKMLVAQETTLLSNVEKRKYEFLKKNMIEKRQGEVLSKLNKFTQRLKANNPNDWMCHNLKFHIDSHNAYNMDKKNQERKGRTDDNDDGGLKVEYEHYNASNEEIDLEQLYNLAKDDKE